MTFFNNKHVVTACIVAPILAVLTYYLVDLAVKEQPQPAITGSAYKLIAQSNCRYSSGVCDLVNGSFKSTLTVVEVNDQQTLVLISNNNLQQASVGFVNTASQGLAQKSRQELGPFALTNTASDQRRWTLDLHDAINSNTQLRLALTANDTYYFAETSMGFRYYETSFNKK